MAKTPRNQPQRTAAVLRLSTWGGVNVVSNRMELTAVINGLSLINSDEKAILYSDSQYVINGITKWIKNWKKKNWMSSSGKVANKDLWETLDNLTQKYHVEFKWIRGHSTDEIHEVDQLAKQQIK